MLQEKDKAFYSRAANIALPILAQGLLTYLVGFIDNIMVGQIGTEAMSGVAIGNQLHFVYATCLLGIVAGGSVFGAQFYGSKDRNGFRESFRFRFLVCLALSVIAFFILLVFGKRFISLFLYTRGGWSGRGHDPAVRKAVFDYFVVRYGSLCADAGIRKRHEGYG